MSQYQKIEVQCSVCNTSKSIQKIAFSRSKKKNNGLYVCRSCKAKNSLDKKPQCNKNYWTETKRALHGESIKLSEKYHHAISHRELSGKNNPMYGKHHTKITKKKMSQARIGKIGINATAWKGGKLSLTCRVKGIIHTRYNWYKRVYQRDNFCCVDCKSKRKLDAHHIKPVWKIIKELLIGKNFATEEEKLEWLVSQPDLKDEELKNGQTLCRDCHKKHHKNWGSHCVR
jgi:hypothetical protein